MAIYRERIEAAIRPLLDAGFRVTDVLEDARNFGNTRMVLQQVDIHVRVTSDRGEFFLDVAAPEESGWFDMNELLRLTGHDVALQPWRNPGEAVDLFRQNRAMLVESLRRADILSKARRRA
jgi:hypothetical protein